MFTPATETVMSVAVKNPKACKSDETAPNTPLTLSPEGILHWFWVSPPLLKGTSSQLRDRKLPCTNRKQHRDQPRDLGVRGLQMTGQTEGVTATGSGTHYEMQGGAFGIARNHLEKPEWKGRHFPESPLLLLSHSNAS